MHDFMAYESSDGLFRHDVEGDDVIALAPVKQPVYLLEEVDFAEPECSGSNDTEVLMDEQFIDLQAEEQFLFEVEEENRVLAAVGLVSGDYSPDIVAIQKASWLDDQVEVNEAIETGVETHLEPDALASIEDGD
jgi:hypothetical protein